MEELITCVQLHDIHIIGVAESWLTDFHISAETEIEGFKAYRKDRSNVKSGRGGGVLLYVKNSIISYARQDLNIFKCESFFCNILLEHQSELCVGVCYKSDSSTDEEIEQLFSVIRAASAKQVGLVIMGDFNFPGIDWLSLHSDSDGEQFFDLINDAFLTQHVHVPTRGDNTLDLVFSSEEGMIEDVRVSGHLANSDHNIVNFKLIKKSSITVNRQPTFAFHRGDYVKMNQWFSNISWIEELGNVDVNTMWNKFEEIVNVAIQKFVPRQVIKNRRYPRWMTRDVIRVRNFKERMWRRYRESKSLNDKVEYQVARNKTIEVYRKAKRNFERKLAHEIKSNPKVFYSYVRSKYRTKDTVGPLQNKDGIIIADGSGMCEELNEYFSTVFTCEDLTNIADIMPKITAVFHGDQSSVLQNIAISQGNICMRLKRLDPNKAPGVDGLVPRLLVETADTLCVPLYIIYSKSLEEGCVPSHWKQANVSPIYKKSGSKEKASNYRPISLTSQACKLLESMIRDSIFQHLSKFDLIRATQHGFVNNRSCLTNLLEYFDIVTRSVDKGEPLDVIYLDFQKAFDKVPHKRLLLKLQAHGIGGILAKWIESWLTDREQRVVLNGCTSSWSAVHSGVPQGSVLGPLLFVIYINDIDVTIGSNLLKFADDAKVFRSVSIPAEIEILREDLRNLFSWSKDWQMLFNVEKCQVVHFGFNNPKVSYTLADHKLKEVSEVKDLGVIIQEDLKVSQQCSKVIRTANQVLGMIYRSFQFKSSEIILPLYKSLVRPHLEYCVQAWRPHLQKDIDLLEKVQRRATRMIVSLKNVPYEKRLNYLRLTTLETRRTRGDLIQVFKILKGFVDVDCTNLFTLSNTNLRGHSLKLYKPSVRLDCRKYFFTNRVVDEWNKLTEDIVSCNSVNSFKNKLDQHLRFSRGFI